MCLTVWFDQKTKRIELPARLDVVHESGNPQFTFDATGSSASVDIIEWRGTVKEGEMGRYAPEDAHMEISMRNVNRPFTFLHEDRQEFKNHSYTFSGDKMRNQLKRIMKKRITKIEAELAESTDTESTETSES